ncbi:MAG: wax ester/triacylglycerol synthase family O-acyltransferase [Chloroflexi bacterium]|nr:wax ester/triacylglycerol synthase family O-acyltransferase [Chloroflexota bacterium]
MRENFSLVDAAWLHMDEPTNMAVIVGVIMFEKPLEFARLKKLVRERLLRVPRFRQRVREPLFGVGIPQWENDPHFDLDAHLHRIALPAPHDQAALHDLVGDFMSVPLDFSKPLWQFHLVEDYAGGCALICRLHHSMADGLALVQVLLSMADNAPVVENDRAALTLAPNANGARKRGGMVQRAFKLARTGTQYVGAVMTSREKMRDTAWLGASSSLALGKLLFIGPDTPSPFKGKCGVVKRVAWTKPLPLAEVKYVARALGGTINDTLISAVAGALRRYLDARDMDTTDMNLRAIVPVNLRAPGDLDLDSLGNRFGLVFLSLPVGVEDPLLRMAVLKDRMDDIKRSPEALVAYGILGTLGATPVAVERVVNMIFGMKATAVMTNVPGPREPLYLAQDRITGLMFWVPTPANLALGVSIISYAGEVIVGINTDANLIPDPDEIVSAFVDEFHALQALAAQRTPREPKALPSETTPARIPKPRGAAKRAPTKRKTQPVA